MTNVLQRPPNIGFDEPGTLEAEGLILVFNDWDRHGAIPWHGFGLAVTAANSTVGLPTTPQSRTWTEEEIESIVRQNPDYGGNPDNPDDDLRSILENEEPRPRSCSAVGQARAVVAVWVAAVALDRGEEVLRAALGASPTSPVFWIDSAVSQNVATTMSRADAQLAEQLLDLPPDAVTNELKVRWEELLDPATRSSELASWFGLPAPPPPDPDLLVGPCT